MALAIPVQMYRKRKVGRRFELMHAFLEQQRIGAQIDEFFALDDAFDDAHDVFVNERLAAWNRYDRRTALVHRCEALGNAQTAIEDLVGIVDFAATGTREIAAEQRLQHQHDRIAAHATQLLADDVARYAELLNEGNSHDDTPSSAAWVRAPRRASTARSRLKVTRSSPASCSSIAVTPKR